MRKTERLDLIRKIVSEQDIETQQELVAILKDNGVVVTQATISRDIDTIGIIKVKNNRGGYVYGLSSEAAKRYMSPLQRASEDILSLSKGSHFNENLLHFSVVPGSTKYLKRLILEEFSSGIFSLIVDDDSLLLVAQSPDDASALYETFDHWIKKK
ncbi:arginine repressor [Streptococcus pluranimalium]|uniref:arginine repressor n=1 Tax=Streptococcus hyovaginalis TaxID=149015 RepID=UPI002A83893B|nr:ArgR family transcriptional regulator [Streptococcus hyovaginalis]MDY4510819.1 ArgR family transcriptional regulator [Streptococcus hyovaginalis]MDY5973354.1 ArgR family transcriptional regulator [Streptococcus hyovaginalis]